jgi:hypothetical protein
LELQAVLWGVLMPGLIAGIGALLLVSRTSESKGISLILLLATLSFATGYIGLFGWPPLPSDSRTLAATDWLVWFILVAGVIQLFDDQLGRFAVFARWSIGGSMLYLIMRATIEYQWEGAEVARWMAIIALVGYALWRSLVGLADRVPSRSVLTILFCVFTGLAICSALTGSSKIAQMTGLFCSTLGAFVIVSWMKPLPKLRVGDITLFALAAFGLGLCALFYSELPVTEALLITGGGVIPWIVELPYFRSWNDRKRGALRIVFVIAIVAVAVTRSALAFESNPYGDYEY